MCGGWRRGVREMRVRGHQQLRPLPFSRSNHLTNQGKEALLIEREAGGLDTEKFTMWTDL